MREYWEKYIKPLLLSTMSSDTLDAARCTPGQVVRNFCVEFASDHAARHAIVALHKEQLRYTDPDTMDDWEIRARPDRTLPQRLMGRAVSAVWRSALPALQRRKEFEGFALGGISKRGLLYARKGHIVRQLFVVSEQGDGSTFLFAPRPGLASFGVDPEATNSIIEDATTNLLV